jgi:MFS superfamily sulfate permease-like transporter
MTGVIVRSGVNVNAGAQTRLSTMLHGLWLLLFVALLPFVVKLIPVASLAALLVYTGYKLADFRVARELAKFGKSEVAIYATTVICIVALDLLTGVLVGFALAIAKLLRTVAHLEIKIADDTDKNRTNLWLTGAATFVSLPKFASALESVRKDTELHMHLEKLNYIDHACLDLLMNWQNRRRMTGGTVIVDWSALGAVFRDRAKQTRGLHYARK